jgi:hypothetical protein
MDEREASCSCGQLTLVARGEPVRLSVCHCLECQRRTGSVFGYQARFLRENVTISGEAREFVRDSDDGDPRHFFFCPNCGATMYWLIDSAPELVAVAVGTFADPTFPPPRISVYESRKHSWVTLPSGLDRENG